MGNHRFLFSLCEANAIHGQKNCLKEVYGFEILILEIERCPALYDCSLKEY